MAHEPFPPEMQSGAVFISQKHDDFDCKDTKSNRNNKKGEKKITKIWRFQNSCISLHPIKASLMTQKSNRMEIKRDLYLQKLIDRQHNGMIKVITGVRRRNISFSPTG